MVKGIGAARMKALLDYFGDARSAWDAHPDTLRAAKLPAKALDNLLQKRDSVDLALVWEQLQEQGIQVTTWLDEDYPRRLKDIEQSPPVLYLRGEVTADDDWAVAVVGTRRVTAYGRQVAEELGAYLAHNGITVVSGLARGVDAIAHKAALDAGGRSIAVLGSGVDHIYPAEHRGLAERLISQGALVSDYSPGTPPEGSNFPPRNRIISGLAQAVVIVEAGKKSGALITAKFAVEQAREVFAVPGNINAPQSKGPNRLIQEGARPLLNPKDILDILNLTMVTEQRAARLVLPADATEALLLEALSLEPRHVDEIRNQTALPIEKVSATLALMELKGMVRRVGGMNYVAIHERKADYRVDE